MFCRIVSEFGGKGMMVDKVLMVSVYKGYKSSKGSKGRRVMPNPMDLKGRGIFVQVKRSDSLQDVVGSKDAIHAKA